jgi:hypothetical protein
MAELGVAPIVPGHIANHRTTTKAGITLGVYGSDLHLWDTHSNLKGLRGNAIPSLRKCPWTTPSRIMSRWARYTNGQEMRRKRQQQLSLVMQFRLLLPDQGGGGFSD